jgi:hypothetical protein
MDAKLAVLLISIPIIFSVLYLIAGTFAAIAFCRDKVFKPIPFYKKIIMGYCLILYPIKRFRYWALKDLSPGITYKEFLEIL